MNYLRDPSKVILEDNAGEGLLQFQQSGYRLIVVSNQSGIARSLVSVEDLKLVNNRISELLENYGVTISAWHHCPHLPEEGCSCRKPGVGMYLLEDSVCHVHWKSSIMVGDKQSDIEAGLSLGLLTALVTTGYGRRNANWALERGITVVESILDLARLVIE